ncbi:hypothetical protein I317_05681 [Kwoniella heveanensis CBS 569]|nr:hypothetical protein I317_05681 [Kwoniella heveanensis CBS 569]
MTLTPPLFCSMCAAPCLLPRINPNHLSSPSTSASCSSSDYNPNSNSNSPAGSSESSLALAKRDWLSEWYCLRVSSGIIDPTPFFFHHFGETALPPPFHSELDSKFQSSSNSSSGSNSASAGLGGSGKSAQTHTQTPETPPPRDGRRCITIHAYCLFAVRSMIRQSTSSVSSTTAGSTSNGNGVGRAGARTHEEGVMLSWSLPRWTGHGPWIHRDMRDPKAWTWPDRSRSDTTRRGDGGGSSEAHQRGDGWDMSIGYWGGTAAQRERWQRTGDHLEADNLVSPLSIGRPSSSHDPLFLDRGTVPHRQVDALTRPDQRTALTKLPLPILTRICQYILDDPARPACLSSCSSPASQNHVDKDGGGQYFPTNTSCTDTKTKIHKPTTPSVDLTPLLDPTSIQTFLSFLQTCSSFYHGLALDLPSWIWDLLTLDPVRRYRCDLLKRWRANPSGVGSASCLWSALDKTFYYPVLDIIQERQVLARHGEIFTYTHDHVNVASTDIDHMADERATNADANHLFKIPKLSISTSKEISAKDVWIWWHYDPRWKSRRRVWWCVVHGCATARDADWW